VHIRVAGPYDRANVALAERPLVFGRDPRCDVVLEDPAVAPRHAMVQRTPRGVEVVDLGPPGGLRLDGATVRHGIVGPGHAVHIGATTLTFDVRDEIAHAAQGAPPVAHGPGAYAAAPARAPSAPSYPAYVPAAPRPPPKKSGAGLAIALALLALVALALGGGFVAWRQIGGATTAASASASSPAPPPRAGSATASPSARPPAAPARASAAPSSTVAPNATAGIEPLVFDRNPFTDD
jgi:hypothetical protein